MKKLSVVLILMLAASTVNAGDKLTESHCAQFIPAPCNTAIYDRSHYPIAPIGACIRRTDIATEEHPECKEYLREFRDKAYNTAQAYDENLSKEQEIEAEIRGYRYAMKRALEMLKVCKKE